MNFNNFNCIVCHFPFDDSIHLPRMLNNCSHSVCSLCLSKSILSKSKTFICPKDNKIYSNALIMTIASLLCIFTIVLILCYRRVVYRDIEETLVEKIQAETIKSIDKFSKAKIEKNKLNEEEEDS